MDNRAGPIPHLVLVLDPQGKVSGIVTGYTPSLQEDLMCCVEELLDEERKG
jgi:hypothetical protein